MDLIENDLIGLVQTVALLNVFDNIVYCLCVYLSLRMGGRGSEVLRCRLVEWHKPWAIIILDTFYLLLVICW